MANIALFGLDIGVISGAQSFIKAEWSINDDVREQIVAYLLWGATAGALAESPFVGGSFQANSDLWRRESFVAPGAPRAAWVGVRYLFGGR